MALTKVTGSVIKDSVSLSGNVSVGGTLTYQDVTNVDALGIGTFRTGIKVLAGQVDVGSNIKLGNAGIITASGLDISGDIDLDGHTELDNVSIAGVTTVTGMLNANGDMTITSPSPTINFTENNGDPDYRIFLNGGIFTIDDVTNNIGKFSITTSRITLNDTVLVNDNILYIGDKLVHWTDDDTAIRFPANDTVTVETAGSERVRIDSSGNVSILNDLDVDGHTNLDNVSIAGVTTITGASGNLLNVNHTAGSGGQGIIRTKASQANSSSFIRAEDSGTTYIGLLKYGTGHSAYGALGAGDGALYANSGGGNSTNITIMADSATGYINFATGGNTERLRIASDGKVGINSITPAEMIDVRGTSLSNKFTARSHPVSSYTTSTAGYKFGARGSYALSVGGSRNSNGSSFTMFELRDFNNSKYFDIEISFHHAGGGIHGSYRRFAGMCNGYTSIQTLHDTGNVNVGGGGGFGISKPDNNTLRVTWNGASGYADNYALYCLIHASYDGTYFSYYDSAFY